MRGDTGRSIMLENVLNRPRRDMLTLLADKQRTFYLVSYKSPDSGKGIIIDENNPHLVTFSPDTDSMFIKIDILDIHITKLRYPHSSGINGSYNEFISRILNRIYETENLTMFKISYLLLLDTGTFNATQGVCQYSSLGRQEAVK